MPTLLTTSRMDPRLAARIEASVAGKRRAAHRSKDGLTDRLFVGAGLRARAGGVGRLVAGATVAVVVVVAVWHAREKQGAFERARAALLSKVEAAHASLTPSDLATTSQVESWILKSATRAPYDGDFIDGSLRGAGSLEAALGAGSVYIRGTEEQLRMPGGIARAAAASVKDTFLTCLVAPPATRNENALLDKVHRAYAGDLPAETDRVSRLSDLQLGLPFLEPSWAAKVAAAPSLEELRGFERAFQQAPIAQATRGMKARLLIFAMDEPGDPRASTELDGERPHPVRLGLVDLTSATMLMRMRKSVDPAGLSPEKRPLYATGLDSCVLALDVRETLARPL